MVANVASALSVALMICALLVVGLPERADDIVIRDGDGVPRVLIGLKSDGTWGIDVNGPDGKTRVSIGYADAANTTYAVFAIDSGDRAVAIIVNEDLGRAHLHVGPAFKAADGEESGDAIGLESRQADGLCSIGVYAGPRRPRITLESQEPQSALLIFDEAFKPRAAFVRRRGKFGWGLWSGDGATTARVAESAAGLEVDLDK